MSEFDHFDPALLAFLSDLRANNSRDWFQAEKKRYDAVYKAPAKACAAHLAAALTAMTGVPQTSKLYRINRDLRFSKDKTPYNTHLHLSFGEAGAGANAPMWFFGVDPDGLTLGCGVFQFDKDGLERYRARIASTAGDALMAALQALPETRLNAPQLKRVPAGYGADHPRAEFLRRKGLAVWRDFDDPGRVAQPGFMDDCIAVFATLQPVHRWLSF
jgi:uncharacterized protein (TIGR02453 family)